MSQGDQHEVLDSIIREAGRPEQWGAAYDVLVLLRDRPDLLGEVRDRVDAARIELWKAGPPSETASRPPPPERDRQWNWLFVVGLVLAGLFCFGVPPLVVGVLNLHRPERRNQSRVLIAVGAAWLIIYLVVIITGGASSEN
jgi:hypothetical protein